MSNIRNLTSAITLQAVKDFIDGNAKKRQAVLRDLRSAYMRLITDGLSLVVAEQLELHPEEIAERLRRNCADMV